MAQQKYMSLRDVAERFGVCDLTVKKWSRNPALGMPPHVLIAGRRYFDIAEIKKWERANKSKAVPATKAA